MTKIIIQFILLGGYREPSNDSNPRGKSLIRYNLNASDNSIISIYDYGEYMSQELGVETGGYTQLNNIVYMLDSLDKDKFLTISIST